ncbi:MAG: pantoate--beta-alanine ligase, partial [Gaiellales bacterium]
GDVALVPTMGALHEGHRALLRAARLGSETVVMSLFVNPTQFLPGEDFERYPRDEQADLRVAQDEAVDIAFVPAVEAIYPPGFATVVDPGPLGDELEGRARPGHFRGVATVVTRLLGLVRADRALFGEKDYQQLAVIRSVARDLALAVEIVGVPTVRTADGLALSSRNRYLTAEQHEQALGLHAGLRAAAGAHASGERDPARLVAVAREPMPVEPEYLELRRDNLSAYDPAVRAVLLVAARFGSTRLIDNIVLEAT